MNQNSLVTGMLSWVVLGLALSFPATAAKSPDEERAEVREMSQKVLNRLYSLQPGAKKAVEGSAGYAVFSSIGTKILVVGGGSGKGVAVNRKTGAETFMKMVEVQGGLGIGVKKFQLVWVFTDKAALDKFVNSGWEVGGQATAAAQYEGQGASTQGALSVSPGVWLYQLTDDGLALELTVKGTKYYKDDELN
jgi:lipid-binding SYLF domain-containing protein